MSGDYACCCFTRIDARMAMMRADGARLRAAARARLR